jgi:hypothetical protein
MSTGENMSTYSIISGRAVRAFDANRTVTFARSIVTDDLVTVEDRHGALTAWVIGIQDTTFGYVTLVLDTPHQPTYWAMSKDDVLIREGHDYTDFANAWEEAQAKAHALQG